ncbi:MAG TPA: PEP-CTERM sorting domain-containing protein [Tepidisphaeraceae bacterium]
MPSSGLSNAGTIQAINGGIVTLNTTYTNTGTVLLNTGVLNLGGTFNTAGGIGNFSNTAGTVNVTGTISNVGNNLTLNNNTGSWNLVGGTISGGSLSFAGGQTLIPTSSSGVLSSVTINGDITFPTDLSRVFVTTGTTFNTAHLSGTRSEIGFAAGYNLVNSVQFEGATGSARYLTMGTAGSFNVASSGVIKTVAGFTGDVQIGGGGFAFSSPMALNNSGLISSEASGRTIVLMPGSGLANAGTIQAINGGIITLNTTYTNTGTILLNSGGIVNLGGTFNAGGGIGNFSNTGGTVNVTGTINNTGNNLTLNNNTGSWNLVGGTINGGSLSYSGGQTLAMTSSNGNLSGLTINGDISFPTDLSRVFIGTGTTFSTAHLTGTRSEIGLAAGYTLANSIQFEGATGSSRYLTMGTAGSFNVASSGVIKTVAGFTGDVQIGGGGFAFSSPMALNNNGLISSEVSGRTISVIPGSGLVNSGTIQAINGGIVTLNTTYTNTGTILLNGGGVVNLGGTFNAGSGIGNFANTGGTVNVTGTINNTGNNLTLNDNTGSWNVLGGTINGGSLSYANGKTLILTSSNGSLLGLTVNGDLNFPTDLSRAFIGTGTTFNIAHLTGTRSEIGFAAGYNLVNSIQCEGATGSVRYLTMGTAGSLNIGSTGVIKTLAGFTGDVQVGGGGFAFSSPMTLNNNGLISSEVSGRTISLVPGSGLSNAGTIQAINGGIITLNTTYTNTGTILLNGGIVNLGGTFNAGGGIGNFANSGGTVNVTGTINNTGNNLTLNSNTGSWNLLGGTITGGSLSFANGQTLNLTSSNGVLSGLTVNGDLSFPTSFSRVLISNGTTFATAHLFGANSEIGFTGGSTLNSTIQFEGTTGSARYLTLSSAGSFTIGSSGVVKTVAGLTGDVQFGGGGFAFSSAMNLVNNGLISSEVAGRTITVLAPTFANAGTVQAVNGGIINVGSNAFTNTGHLRVSGGGKFIANSISGNLNDASVDGLNSLIRLKGTYAINQPVAVTNRATLNLQGTWTKSANIDASGRIIFDYTGPTIFSTIRSQILSGRNGGLWNGPGINSSATAATPLTGVGYGEASAVLGISGTQLGAFSGEAVDATAVLVRWTRVGDADLDGDADGVDIGTWATNFTGELGGTGTKLWTQGDWDYDGDADGVDAGLWAQAFTGELGGAGLGSLVIDDPNIAPGAAAILRGMGVTVVPEPAATIGLLGVAAGALLRRARRRRV